MFQVFLTKAFYQNRGLPKLMASFIWNKPAKYLNVSPQTEEDYFPLLLSDYVNKHGAHVNKVSLTGSEVFRKYFYFL